MNAADFDDVLIIPAEKSYIESRADVVLENRNGYVPLSAANMVNIGTFDVAEILQKRKWLTYIQKDLYTQTEWQYFLDNIENPHCVIPTFGKEDPLNIKKFFGDFVTPRTRPRKVCLDYANGHIHSHITRANYLYELLAPQNIDVIYGNVANPDVLHHINRFIQIKIGIGSGSVCTTRLKTGVGVPQLDLISWFASSQLGRGRYIISDGGIRKPADIVKAFCSGADEVMMGGYFAGHNETSTEFFGSASTKSPFYDASKEYSTPEGKVVQLLSRGPIENTLKDVEGSLRSAMTYINVKYIDDIKHSNVQIKYVNKTHDNY